ncbi:sugar ABC transporter substrate-binding protein [Vreelandella titanicae]|jgi:simple sugar transport system substrate-binding protein|uniref:sugar ABC transporter substrate-binding protein n=1 Tax=Halomonadaceae TaxID=28256 RepID=UPI0004851C99|nr:MULTISPECIES: sugar ABC transporter substrate-binding protein [Halomonas]NAO94657.1 substrate-binding domain-containing protein [Halomonas sp. MG34]MCE7520175.1 sugar ABC transporter substrate-binding protein [Halomonas titanicae]PKH62051.1 LacI family transcriptional regulator [Halomonas sp. Choline-3u-9]QNU64204.1 sugar ABC transporter substrate-binding protein [Halomonas titanicae]SDJ31943.1 monosaccharide ABC transporter substrate-binding protein, CUT2 family [Halomonas titanicae]
MARLSQWLLASAATTVLMAGAAQAQEPEQEASRFVMVTHGVPSDPFWSVVKNGAEAAADLVGAELEYRAPSTFDMAKMQQLVQAAVASDPDGLILSFTDENALGGAVQNAVDNGIPVITINSGGDVARDYGARLHIGQSEYEAGKQAAERMQELGVEKGVCVNHEQGNQGLDQRCDGFVEGFDGNAEQLATTYDPTNIRNAIVAYLNENSDVRGVLTLGALAADPMIRAMREQGATDMFTLGTFDLSPGILEALDAGELDFAIDQQQYMQGYLPVMFLDQFVKNGLLPAGDVATGPGFVTQENAAQVIELSSQGIR